MDLYNLVSFWNDYQRCAVDRFTSLLLDDKFVKLFLIDCIVYVVYSVCEANPAGFCLHLYSFKLYCNNLHCNTAIVSIKLISSLSAATL